VKGIRGLFIACSLTCLIAFLFSFIMKESSLGLRDTRYLAAIATNEEHRLNEGNMVDLLSRFVQTEHFSKVYLRNQSLYIDIKLTDQMTPDEQLLEEVPDLIQFVFFQTSNIDHLYIRVVEKTMSSRMQNTYLTLHITKEDEWLLHGMEEISSINWLHDVHWMKQLRMEKESNV